MILRHAPSPGGMPSLMTEPRKSRWWVWLLALLAAGLGGWLFANWSEFHAGFQDGYTRQTQPRP